MSEKSIPDMLREIGRSRRTEGQMVRRELHKRQRRAQMRQRATHLLNALGYLIVVAAVVVVLLSL